MSPLILESSTAYLAFVLCSLQSHHKWSKTGYVLLQEQSRDIAEVKLEMKHEITTEDHCIWMWAGECIIKIIMYRQRDMGYCYTEGGGNSRGTWSLCGQVCSYCKSLLLLLTMLFTVPTPRTDFLCIPLEMSPFPLQYTTLYYCPVAGMVLLISFAGWQKWHRPMVSQGNTSVGRGGALNTDCHNHHPFGFFVWPHYLFLFL